MRRHATELYKGYEIKLYELCSRFGYDVFLGGRVGFTLNVDSKKSKYTKEEALNEARQRIDELLEAKKASQKEPPSVEAALAEFKTLVEQLAESKREIEALQAQAVQTGYALIHEVLELYPESTRREVLELVNNAFPS